jgi:hypothetical protein
VIPPRIVVALRVTVAAHDTVRVAAPIGTRSHNGEGGGVLQRLRARSARRAFRRGAASDRRNMVAHGASAA